MQCVVDDVTEDRQGGRVEKYEAGAFDDDAKTADLIQQYEARIAALLGEHPNIVKVLDHTTDPTGQLAIVMEYVDGIDLDP